MGLWAAGRLLSISFIAEIDDAASSSFQIGCSAPICRLALAGTLIFLKTSDVVQPHKCSQALLALVFCSNPEPIDLAQARV
jgi:hypothetical protein